jgi:hypothetical protein
MAGCWRVLDPFYSRPTQYAQDLMSEITVTRKIQHSEYEKLFEYYALIRGNITEARKASLMEALLTQANIALMEHPLPTREIEEWRSRQAGYAPRYHADAFVEFVDDREEWALKNVEYSTAPSSHSSNNENQKGRKGYERKEAKVMAVKAVGKKEPNFPPPKRWSPDHPWGRPCIVNECREEHAPPFMCTVQKQDTGRKAGFCPAPRALHTLLQTLGHEEVLVTGEGEQLQCPRVRKRSQLSAARRLAEQRGDDGKRPARTGERARVGPQVQADGGRQK